MSSTLPIPLRTVLAAALALVPLVARADGERAIAIDVEGLRSNEGAVRAGLYASADGWTSEGREIASCRARIVEHRAHCVFEGVSPGTYAVALLHDEDDDGHMRRDVLGVPQEGYGFSNDAAVVLGPPSFGSARFTHASEATRLRVHARYGI
jgi:uncharacterized protein (DUF2141 family)